MLRRLIAAGLAFVAAGVTSITAVTPATAQEAWVVIKSKPIAVGTDRDRIDLTDSRGAFRAVRLVVKQRGVQISNVDVVYEGGPAHQERRAINLLPGERTRTINAGNADRFINEILLTYSALPQGPQPVIEVQGLQTPAGRDARRTSAPKVAAPAPAPAQGTAQVQGGNTTPQKAAPATNAAAADTGQVLFGSATVAFANDKDVIRVGSEVGLFDRIRMRVLDNDIFLNSLRVVYANGESEELAVNAAVRRNSYTQWFQLKGDRFIKEIVMQYRSNPASRDRAFVEVFGEYAEGWLAPNGKGKGFNGGWVLLGAQTADFGRDVRDVIRVGRNEGGFRKIRINVRDEKLTLWEVRIVYGNGEVDIIPANRTIISPGGVYGPIDLKGGSRVIQEIRPSYRTQVAAQGAKAILTGSLRRATVEFWGQH